MRRRYLALLLVVLVAAAAIGSGRTFAAFSATTANSSSLSSTADFIAPAVTRASVSKQTGYAPDYIHQGGTYYVYAQVTDSGNPSSGISSVTADVSQITTGATALALTAGSYSEGGQTYNYRSAVQTANATLTGPTKTYAIATRDGANNNGSQTGLTVNIDNTAPTVTGMDVQAQNATGNTVGRLDQNDTLTYTFSEPMDPNSFLFTWTGASTAVVVRLTNNAANDRFAVFDSTNFIQLPFGTIALGGDYATGTVNYTASTMVMSGSTVTVTLGTPSAPGNRNTVAGNATMVWTPSTLPYDRALNAWSTSAGTTVTESGAADPNF